MSTVPGKYVFFSIIHYIFLKFYMRTTSVCPICMKILEWGMRLVIRYFSKFFSVWQTFNELQKLISKTHGKVVGDLMTPSPLVVRDSTNLEDAARFLLLTPLYVFPLHYLWKQHFSNHRSVSRLLLETKFRRLPVVDSDGKLVRISLKLTIFPSSSFFSVWIWFSLSSLTFFRATRLGS